MMYDIFEEVKLYGRLLQKFEIKIREKSWKHGVYIRGADLHLVLCMVRLLFRKDKSDNLV